MTNKKKIIIWICFVLVLFSVFPAYKFYEIYNHIANTFLCDKAIVVFESDDWGMCGVRDIETFDFLIQSGVPLDDDPWGYYSLETVYDLEKLYQILSKHRDVSGQHPVFTCNFIVANPDFEKIQNGGYENYFYKSLSEGLPSKWERGNLYQKYMEGIDKGLIYPGFHGREHFNEEIWLRLLRANDKLATALFKEQMMFGMSKLWEKIHGSYFIPPSDFRSSESQRENIHDGVRI